MRAVGSSCSRARYGCVGRVVERTVMYRPDGDAELRPRRALVCSKCGQAHGMAEALFPTTDQDRTVEDLMTEHLAATVEMFTGTRSLGAEFVGEPMCRVYADNGQGAYIIAPDGRVIA